MLLCYIDCKLRFYKESKPFYSPAFLKPVSFAFTKFIYSPAFKMSFNYNACSEKLLAGSGIALLLGKDLRDYRANRLVRGNQGVKFNDKGLSFLKD